MIEYEGTVIRPPSEAASLILQITLGCSDNRCSFCPAYKEKEFAVKDTGRVEAEMQAASRLYPDTRRIFFADGDAITVPQEKLAVVFRLAHRYFPRLSRIALYGSVKGLERKSVEDLKELRELKLGIVYLGFETGDEAVYRNTNKYGSPEGNVSACRKVKAAGMTTNATIILGLGGRELSRQHAVNTARILNAAQPDQVAALTLMVVPGTPLFVRQQQGGFAPLDDFGFLEELKTIIENLDNFRCQFFANHASNYYPVRARFPRERQAVLDGLCLALARRDRRALTPDFLRGL